MIGMYLPFVVNGVPVLRIDVIDDDDWLERETRYISAGEPYAVEGSTE